MHEISAEQARRVEHLIRNLPYQIPALSVLAGNHYCRIWVDDPGEPRVALLWASGDTALSGEPSESAIESLARVFSDQIIPAGMLSKSVMTSVQYHPLSWADFMSRLVPSRLPVSDRRKHFYLDRSSRVAREEWPLPRGFSLERVRPGLVAEDALKNIEPLREELTKMWPAVDDFFDKGFGFCVVHDSGALASWCLSEYPSKDTCGIGVETIEEYQRRGLATAAARACFSHALALSQTA